MDADFGGQLTLQELNAAPEVAEALRYRRVRRDHVPVGDGGLPERRVAGSMPFGVGVGR